MILTIYEELYQTPIKICFGVNCNENVNLVNPPLKITSQNDYNFLNEHLLRNHQNRAVIDKTTKRSQQGLEKRAQHQETKRIILSNERFISDILKTGVQSKRSQKHRKKDKYRFYSYNN